MTTTFNPPTIDSNAFAVGRTLGPGYYIVRFDFERDPGVTDSGIILLPEGEVTEMANFAVYMVNHQVLGPKVECAQVMNKQAPPHISKILSAARNMSFLMYPNGTRIKVPEDSTSVLHKLLMRTKPLWDEHAMLYTAVDKAKPFILQKENFGTWAAQFVEAVQQRSTVNGFFWKTREEAEKDAETLVDMEMRFNLRQVVEPDSEDEEQDWPSYISYD